MTACFLAANTAVLFLLFAIFFNQFSFQSKLELLTPEGLRIDGRRSNELRKVNCRLAISHKADGSCYLEQGNTKILATVYGPHEAPFRSKTLHDRAVINVEYSLASFSTSERKKSTKRDRRQLEIASMIEQTFEHVIMTNLFPRSQIDIFIHVLQSDGGNAAASINAATLALIDSGIPMSDYVCAVSASSINGVPVLDLNYLEESSGSTELTLAVMPKSKKITLLQMESRLHVDLLEKIMTLASLGCGQLQTVLNDVVHKRSQELLESRGV